VEAVWTIVHAASFIEIDDSDVAKKSEKCKYMQKTEMVLARVKEVPKY
jgi:hypothetical protein